MSCAVEALVEQQMRLIGETTYGWAERLYEDYRLALSDFHSRCQTEQHEREAFAQQQDAATRAAVSMVAATQAQPVEDAAVAFMRERVEQLRQRIAALPITESALAPRCQALLQAIENEPGKLPAHIEDYQRLSEALFSMLSKQNSAAMRIQTLLDELRVLREEIDSSLLCDPESAETRAQLVQQLMALEHLDPRQVAVADQGLSLLRHRVRRELKAAAARQQARMLSAANFREIVGDVTAKLQAISRQQGIVEECARAQALLQQLQAILARSSADDLDALRRLSHEVNSLFADAAKRLEEQDATTYLSDQVTDILTSMGYQVTQLATGTDTSQQLLAGVDDAVGVQFRIDGSGRLGTQMVALNDAGAGAGRASQEKVCSLVDDVLAALRRRHCRVRERFRSSLTPGEQLKVVQLPEAQRAIPARSVTIPKQMRVEEP